MRCDGVLNEEAPWDDANWVESMARRLDWESIIRPRGRQRARPLSDMQIKDMQIKDA
jgi:hypothetical protein